MQDAMDAVIMRDAMGIHKQVSVEMEQPAIFVSVMVEHQFSDVVVRLLQHVDHFVFALKHHNFLLFFRFLLFRDAL